jgi:hypothetical protein
MKWSVFCFAIWFSAAGPPEGWRVFETVKFTSVFYKEHNAHFLTPFFDHRIRAYAEKEFVLQGHYLPLELDDAHVLVLSKNPYAACFFCGGAGPESVAEVHLKEEVPRLKADQVITVKGILRLNKHDVDHLNFILDDAIIVAK